MTDKTIVKMHFGSHLYGTNVPDSDMDFKGVFLPSARDILLGRIPKSKVQNSKTGSATKNSKYDVDLEMYSLHYFLELACKGETVALDMLHAPEHMLLEDSMTWRFIWCHRDRFYTKNLNAFVGYARRQAAKYGIRGSRLNSARRVLVFLEAWRRDTWTLANIWDSLPQGEHLHKGMTSDGKFRTYQVVGKTFQETAKIHYIIPILQKFVYSYGARAEAAARNEGIDWKAVSHALRAAYQTRQILTEKTIIFPLREAPYLIDVKMGKLDYTGEVLPRLEELMDEIERLSDKSDLPEKVDRRFWDDFLADETSRYIMER